MEGSTLAKNSLSNLRSSLRPKKDPEESVRKSSQTGKTTTDQTNSYNWILTPGTVEERWQLLEQYYDSVRRKVNALTTKSKNN